MGVIAGRLGGVCINVDLNLMFEQGAGQGQERAVCMPCAVRTECLADALENRIEFGVWGGMTERERRALLRRRPGVQSWRRLLEAARAEHEATAAVLAPGFDVASAAGAASLAGSSVPRPEAPPQQRAPAQTHPQNVASLAT